MRTSFAAAVAALAVATALCTAPMGALAGEDVLASGSFRGASGHQTSGDVTVRKTAGGLVVELDENFDFDGAPDPKLGFGTDGKYDSGSQISALNSNTGHQVYELPAAVDPEAYNQLYVWCEKYSVPLGVADLQ